jgi:hypothetical protein
VKKSGRKKGSKNKPKGLQAWLPDKDADPMFETERNYPEPKKITWVVAWVTPWLEFISEEYPTYIQALSAYETIGGDWQHLGWKQKIIGIKKA